VGRNYRMFSRAACAITTHLTKRSKCCIAEPPMAETSQSDSLSRQASFSALPHGFQMPNDGRGTEFV